MYIINRTLRFTRGFLLSYGPTPVKKLFWDHEFSNGKWNFLDNTLSDCVYAHLNRFAQNKCVLDLGCGPGNTANEMASGYLKYVGVDISEAALAKARRRSEQNGRADENSFEQGDFLSYVPPQKFDVILFREAMYHVPLGKVKMILDRFSKYLADDGVFIVRLYVVDNGKTKYRPSAMIGIMESEFDVVEKSHYDESGATVVVFRPRSVAISSKSKKERDPIVLALNPRQDPAVKTIATPVNDFIADRDSLVLITGANGFIGPRVVESLLKLGFRNLRCFVRPTSNLAELDVFAALQNDARIEVIRGNLLSLNDCIAATQDAAIVFHLAAGTRRKIFSRCVSQFCRDDAQSARSLARSQVLAALRQR